MHAGVLISTVVFLAPLAANVPLAVLAAIISVVAGNMSDIAHFRYMVRSAPRVDVAIFFITFLVTVFTTLAIAVNVGIVLAKIQFLRRMAGSVDVRTMSETDIRAELPGSIPALVVYAIEGPVFFVAAHPYHQSSHR
jgi:SulP family sulfate permease